MTGTMRATNRLPIASPFGLALVMTLASMSVSGTGRAYAQAEDLSLRQDVEAQYEVTPIPGGIALLPRQADLGVTLIELRGNAVFVDGEPEPRSMQALASTLGPDAALLLRLIYLDPVAQRAVLSLPALSEAEMRALGLSEPTAEATTDAVDAPTAVDPSPPPPERERRVVRGDIVRFGGSARVEVDERVRGDVVVIGGSLVVDGEVHGDVTVVGGSARFGPEAIAHREVTIVGGRLTRDPGARFSRGVNEISVGRFDVDLPTLGTRPWIKLPRPWTTLFRSLDLVGTIIRLAFVGLLGSLVLVLAAGHAQRVASRAVREPVKAGVVGLLAQLLFVPVLVVGSFLLAVTIIGIPLLVLVPVVIVLALGVMLLGFAGVAQGVGQLITGGAGRSPWTAVTLFWLGLVVLMMPTLFGEVLNLTGGSFRVFALTLGLVGFVAEYAAWTTGLGAVILNRFGGTYERSDMVLSPLPVPVPGSGDAEPLDPPAEVPPVVPSPDEPQRGAGGADS